MHRTNKMTTNNTAKNTYIVTGRVEGQEAIVKIIIASNELIATSTMEHFLKTEQEWTVGEDVYVDEPIILQDAIDCALVESTTKSTEERYKKSLNGEIKDVSFSAVIGYEIATQFNPFDQALILDYLLQDTSETKANFDEGTEVLSVSRYDDIVLEVDVNDKDETVSFWHVMCAQEHARLVDLYQNNNLLLDIIDSEEVDFSDIPGMPR